jgi:hypothetical protein
MGILDPARQDIIDLAEAGLTCPVSNINELRLARINGAFMQSNDGGAYSLVGAQSPTGFAHETLLIAQQLMPDRAFNRSMGTDFLPITEASLSAAGTPVVDPTQAGGWVKFSGTAGQLALNPVTPGAATYNPILGTFDSMASPWLIRGRAMLNFQAFTAATSVILASLDGSGVGGGGATHKIQLLSIGSTHLQQLYIRLQNATLGPIDVSAGPDGLLGGANSQVAVNQPFTYTLYFDRVNIKWAFNDQYNNPVNLLNGAAMSGPNMDAMPNDATSVTLQNTDTTNGANISIDALAIAYRAALGNK